MTAAVVAIIAENAVILAIVAAGAALLRQGGGLQLKTAPPPKAEARPRRDTAPKVPESADPAASNGSIVPGITA